METDRSSWPVLTNGRYPHIQKQREKFLFIAEIQDCSFFALDTIKKGDFSSAQKSLETSLDLIQKQEKLKSIACWLVVQQYEQEELADDSEDEKRIQKAQEPCVLIGNLSGQDGSIMQAQVKQKDALARPDNRSLNNNMAGQYGWMSFCIFIDLNA